MRSVADVAQLVEQRIRNAKVTSSIPVIGTRKIKGLGKQLNPFFFAMAHSWHTARK